MSLNVKIRKIGTSKGIIIPQAVLEMMGLDENDVLEVEVKAGILSLKSIKTDNQNKTSWDEDKPII